MKQKVKKAEKAMEKMDVKEDKKVAKALHHHLAEHHKMIAEHHKAVSKLHKAHGKKGK